MITWEPWHAVQKAAIDYDGVLSGKDDVYIREFAVKMKTIGKPILLRFAHEMNGDWYPWSAQKIGAEKYQRLFKYVWRIFEDVGAGDVRWVFSINASNVPDSNRYELCYPGGSYVDYIGLDGYNWGSTQSWSRWSSFKDIFSEIYGEVVRRYKKPVIISEFGTTSTGGDKVRWIDEALREAKLMPAVKALVLFNVDKETDWKIASGSEASRVLKNGWDVSYFKDSWMED
jgi:beta-mannanase